MATSPPSDSAIPEPDASATPAAIPEVPATPDRRLFTSDASLALPEVEAVLKHRGATVVALMGEVKWGKTTLLVEVWNAFLAAKSVNEVHMAGSRTSFAFEQRAWYSRLASEARDGFTLRTREEEDGFLHLRVRPSGGDLVELLLADYSGEHFRRIREGVPIRQELPWMTRADRFLVLVNGSDYALSHEREIILGRVRRQIHALRVGNVVANTGRVALVLTKADQAPEPTLERFRHDANGLLELCREVDSEARVIETAARPADGSPARGLVDVVDFLVSPDPVVGTTVGDEGPNSANFARVIARIG
jgi:Double-GTPase 2